MPIKPENKTRYPLNWSAIRKAIRARSGDRCEGSPAYPDCRAINHQPHPETCSKVVLTVAHLDHQPENCDGLELRPIDQPMQALPKKDSNLRHWCQRCHLTYDSPHHAINAAATRKAGKAMRDLFEVEEQAAA